MLSERESHHSQEVAEKLPSERELRKSTLGEGIGKTTLGEGTGEGITLGGNYPSVTINRTESFEGTLAA